MALEMFITFLDLKVLIHLLVVRNKYNKHCRCSINVPQPCTSAANCAAVLPRTTNFCLIKRKTLFSKTASVQFPEITIRIHLTGRIRHIFNRFTSHVSFPFCQTSYIIFYILDFLISNSYKFIYFSLFFRISLV